MDQFGKIFEAEAYTLDITPVGARLGGINLVLHRGAMIGIQCGRSKGRFRVVWIGCGDQQGQIGVHQVEVGKYIWGKPLERVMGDKFKTSQHHEDADGC